MCGRCAWGGSRLPAIRQRCLSLFGPASARRLPECQRRAGHLSRGAFLLTSNLTMWWVYSQRRVGRFTTRGYSATASVSRSSDRPLLTSSVLPSTTPSPPPSWLSLGSASLHTLSSHVLGSQGHGWSDAGALRCKSLLRGGGAAAACDARGPSGEGQRHTLFPSWSLRTPCGFPGTDHGLCALTWFRAPKLCLIVTSNHTLEASREG